MTEQLLTKTQERITFLTEWIEELNKKTDFESRNQVFVLTQELDSRNMYLRTIKQDMAIKAMDEQLPLMVQNIDKSKLELKQRNEFVALSKRVKNNRYINADHKAKDFKLASELLESIG